MLSLSDVHILNFLLDSLFEDHINFFLAARLMDAINKNVDPCDNFYDYACGSWERLNTIPADRLSYSTFEKLRDQLLERLKGKLSDHVKLFL